MTADPPLFARPSRTRRLVRKTAEILLARLSVGRLFGILPPLRSLYTRYQLARTDHTGLFSGVYPSYAAALAAAPPSRLTGWDHDATANLWVNQIDHVRLSSYPVFLWLHLLVDAGTALLDLGGSIGSTYYGYRRYANFPASASWTVVEVAKICKQGTVIAQREHAENLRFLERLADAGPCDVLLCAGALQYMDGCIPGLVESLSAKPRYILLNKLPITPQPTCWTLQNYGPAVAPQQLFNEADFLAYFALHGYRLRDRWAVEELDCLIPFHPERFIRQFSGFLFELGR